MEGWKSTKSETALLPPGAVIVQPDKAWRGAGSTRIAALPDDGLLLLKDGQPPRHWRRGKEVGVVLDPPGQGGTNISYGISAGTLQFLAMQQYWNEPRRLRRLIASATNLQQPAEQSWPNFDRPGQGWFVEHIKGAAVSDDGLTLVFADNHKNVFAWNAETQEPEKLPLQATDDAQLALSPDGRCSKTRASRTPSSAATGTMRCMAAPTTTSSAASTATTIFTAKAATIFS